MEPYVSVQLYFPLLVFFLHVTRNFVVSDGSSKSPSFHLPAVPGKPPVFDYVGKAQ